MGRCVLLSSNASAEKDLYNAIQYSGLVTEGMKFKEMCEVLSAEYPATRVVYRNGSYGSDVQAFALSGGSGTVEMNTDIFVQSLGVSAPCIGTSPTKFEFNRFKSLTFKVSYLNNNSGSGTFSVGVTTDRGYTGLKQTVTGVGTYTVDISNVTNDGYIFICATYGTIIVSEIVLGQ